MVVQRDELEVTPEPLEGGYARAREDAAVPKRGGQLALKGLAPADGDPFRFTWWNTREGVAVWIEHSGLWRPGVVAALGRKRAAVAIEAPGIKHRLVATS